jgi:DNA-binding transcriptional MerR regulator
MEASNMKIKEVSAITGLTKKTIRFYEEAGLIKPQKQAINGRDFREYSDSDIAQLNEIIVLRKAHFTIEEIKNMQDGSQPIQEVFANYYDRVKSEKKELDRLLCVLDAIAAHSLETKAELVQEISSASKEMRLPFIDIHPQFKYIDELEEKLGIKDGKHKSKKSSLKQTAAITQTTNLAQYQTKPGVRDGSMSGPSVIMAMRMMDDE